MARQITPTRKVQSIRDVNLKLLRARQVRRIKAQREQFRAIRKKQLERADKLTGHQKGKLQKKLTTGQLWRQERQIKRNIAKQKRLRYQIHGGDIAFKDLDKHTKWYKNFASSNVWKFKIRNNHLLVAFLDGSIYMYFGAGKLFLGMTRAGSKGSYVWEQLRRKNISYLKIS